VATPEKPPIDLDDEAGQSRPDLLERAATIAKGRDDATHSGSHAGTQHGFATAIEGAARAADRAGAGANGQSHVRQASSIADIGAVTLGVDARVSEPPMLTIDAAWLRNHNLITPDGARTQVAENFRRIKRHVLANVLKPRPAAPVNRLMVTSALPREGKTFCSINLAISLSQELDRQVLLVDADTLRPNVLAALGLPPESRGLMDLLFDPKLDPQSVIRRTNIDRLKILPAGLPNSRATELLASEHMRSLIDRLAGYYDDRIVIFDSPPVLLASESAALATHMSQILMVVAAGTTTVAALKDALRRLEGCESPVGMVLNKKEAPGSGYAYYGYGYGQAYGASHGT